MAGELAAVRLGLHKSNPDTVEMLPAEGKNVGLTLNGADELLGHLEWSNFFTRMELSTFLKTPMRGASKWA